MNATTTTAINLTRTPDQLRRLFALLPDALRRDQTAAFGLAVDALVSELLANGTPVSGATVGATIEFECLVSDWCEVAAALLTAAETDARASLEVS